MKRNIFTVTFEVCCAECGGGLDINETNNNVLVVPCQKCLERAFVSGEKAGEE